MTLTAEPDITHEYEKPWELLVLDPGALPTPEQMLDLFAGKYAGIVLKNFVDADVCARVMANLRQRTLASYDGMIDALTSLGPTHWEVKYVHGDWDLYFKRAKTESRLLADITEPIGDVRALVNAALEPALGPITPFECPWTGRPLQPMILRSGCAKAHYDNGRFDLPDPLAATVTGQIAWNLYLANPGGGELIIYRHLGVEPGLTKAEALGAKGLTYFGNYDIPEAWYANAEKVAIPVNVGDLVLVPNNWVHAVAPVTPGCDPLDRVGLSAHIAQTNAGHRDFN